MSTGSFGLFFGVLLLLELIYFRIARMYGILDHPNDRSLHGEPTIRGGGIIFPLTAILLYFITGGPDGYYVLGLLVVAVVGFIDDIRTLNSSVRLLFQAVGFSLVMLGLNLTNMGILPILVIFVISVGSINTFNFMDGINGLTGGYGFVTLGSLLYINVSEIYFIETEFIVAMIMAVIIFCFFNFRTRAVCFAGDVGSLALGMTIVFLIIKLMLISGNYVFIGLLSVYGVDSVLTILHRIVRRENIFKPHKVHLYQVMVNYFKVSHIQMSLTYAAVQLMINLFLVSALSAEISFQYTLGGVMVFVLSGIYLFLKRRALKVLPAPGSDQLF